jgi:hypothetical protein
MMVLCKWIIFFLSNKKKLKNSIINFDGEYKRYVNKIEAWNALESSKNFTNFIDFILERNYYSEQT